MIPIPNMPANHSSENPTLNAFQQGILDQMAIAWRDDPYMDWLLCHLLCCLEWVECASTMLTSDEAYSNSWLCFSPYKCQRFLIHQFHAIPHWALFNLMNGLTSQEMVDQHANGPSNILVRALQGSHSEVLAVIESTYTSFLILHERGIFFTEASIGYDQQFALIHIYNIPFLCITTRMYGQLEFNLYTGL
jgi:hypothetical protein